MASATDIINMKHTNKIKFSHDTIATIGAIALFATILMIVTNVN